MLLNAEQERENNRLKKLLKFLAEKKKEYEGRQPFYDEVQLLIGNADRIAPLLPEKGTKGASATEEKKDIKESLGADVNEVCTNVTVYARITGNKPLKYAVRYRTSDITKAKDGDVQGIVTIITDAITPLLTEPAFMSYDITSATLSDLTKKAASFDDSIGSADVIDAGSSIANKQINEAFKDIRTNISNLNLLITWFNKKNPKFVEGYHISAAIDMSGVRHSGIYGVITNSNNAVVTDASIVLTTTTHTGKKHSKAGATNDDGAWEIIKFTSGNAKLTVSAPNCETAIIPVEIIRGKIIGQNITLQSKVVNLTATA